MQDGTVLCQDFQHGRCKATGTCPKSAHRCAVITKKTRVCGSLSHDAKDCRVSTKADDALERVRVAPSLGKRPRRYLLLGWSPLQGIRDGMLVGRQNRARFPGGPQTPHPGVCRASGALACAAEASRLPRRAEVCAVLRSNKTLPDNHIYVGQGHHSHRLPIGKWACPFTPGVNCSTDDWMNLYAEQIMTHLTSDLPQLAGMTLVCDCPLTIPCEADVLAGLVFEQTRPHAEPHPQASGVTRRRRSGAGKRQVVMAAALASQVTLARSMVPPFSQESVSGGLQTVSGWGLRRFSVPDGRGPDQCGPLPHLLPLVVRTRVGLG